MEMSGSASDICDIFPGIYYYWAKNTQALSLNKLHTTFVLTFVIYILSHDIYALNINKILHII